MAKPGSIRKIKFCTYYDRWIETYKKGQVSAETYGKYIITSKSLKKLMPDIMLSDLSRDDYQMALNKYGETHAIKSCWGFMHQVNGAIQDAFHEGWIKRDPTYRVVPTSQIMSIQTRVKYLDQEQANKLLKVCKKHNTLLDLIIDLDIRTGLRLAELLGFTMNDFDSKNMLLNINKAYQYKTQFGNYGAFKPTKNKSSVRVIVLDSIAAQDIVKIHELYPELSNNQALIAKIWEHLGNEGIKTFPDKFFSKKLGTKISRAGRPSYRKFRDYIINISTINNFLKKRCKEAHVPRISMHGCRHTHASLLINAGVSIQSVADRLGHSSTVTTQDTYIHLIKELRQKDNQIIADKLLHLGV